MIEALESDFAFLSEMERYDAFQRLYHSIEEKDAEALERLLASPDPLIPLILLRYLEEIPERPACAAIIGLVERGNEVVAKTAMGAYARSHYPGKARLLKSLILSRNYRACRFAVRTLSRAGFMEVLPLILREIPDRDGPIKRVMVDSLRYLPHRRSLAVLLPLADSKEERMRFLALEVLTELQARTRALSAEFFLKKLKDESERVRRMALIALQRYPTRRVAKMILAAAKNPEEPEDSRVRSVRALAAFPSVDNASSLAVMAAAGASTEIRLAAEIAMRAMPAAVVKKGLLPLLKSEDAQPRLQAATYLAEMLGEDPEVRKALIALWRSSDEADAVELIDVVRSMGGAEAVALLKEAALKSPFMSYSAASAISRIRGKVPGRLIFDMAMDEKSPDTVRQALLDRWARGGPEEDVREELFEKMLAGLASPNMNIRYLSAQILHWYPIGDVLGAYLSLLAGESSAEVQRLVCSQIGRAIGRDPLGLAEAVSVHPDRARLTGVMIRVLLSQTWGAEFCGRLLDILAEEPFLMPVREPERFCALCVHLFEHGSATLQDVWLRLPPGGVRRLVEMLLSAILRPRRRFPLLPLAFLELQTAMASDPRTREIFYRLFAAERRAEAGEFLAAALIREEDEEARKAGAGLLRELLSGGGR